MAAILTPKTGPPSVFEYTTSAPVPTLPPGQIFVKNTFAGINYIDTYLRTGLYPPPPGASLPMIVGQEAAGTVADLNGAPELQGRRPRRVDALQQVRRVQRAAGREGGQNPGQDQG
jgi:NADPH:quinone reductase-like Zn-dependent oxidoreductase